MGPFAPCARLQSTGKSVQSIPAAGGIHLFSHWEVEFMIWMVRKLVCVSAVTLAGSVSSLDLLAAECANDALRRISDGTASYEEQCDDDISCTTLIEPADTHIEF